MTEWLLWILVSLVAMPFMALLAPAWAAFRCLTPAPEVPGGWPR